MLYQMVSIFVLAIVCSLISSIALSWRGIHIVSRQKSLQILCIAQGALAGGLLAILLNSLFAAEGELSLLGLGVVCSFLAGFFVGALVENLNKTDISEKPNLLLSLFVFLLALNALLSAIFPQVETHMSQMFFGDLSTVSDTSAVFAFCVFTFLTYTGFKKRFADANRSFSIVVLDKKFTRDWIVDTAIITFSVQTFGFLFSLGMIMIPTTMARLKLVPGMTRHYIVVAIGAVSGTFLGFITSLANGHLPTVPTILLATFFTTLITAAVYKKFAIVL